MAHWLRRLLATAAWLGGALAAHGFAVATTWPAWVAVPLIYAVYPVGLGLLQRLLPAPPAREELVFEDLLRDGLVFLVLGMIAVPLLNWGGAVAGTSLSPAVPLAVAYVVYVLWPRGD